MPVELPEQGLVFLEDYPGLVEEAQVAEQVREILSRFRQIHGEGARAPGFEGFELSETFVIRRSGLVQTTGLGLDRRHAKGHPGPRRPDELGSIVKVAEGPEGLLQIGLGLLVAAQLAIGRSQTEEGKDDVFRERAGAQLVEASKPFQCPLQLNPAELDLAVLAVQDPKVGFGPGDVTGPLAGSFLVKGEKELPGVFQGGLRQVVGRGLSIKSPQVDEGLRQLYGTEAGFGAIGFPEEWHGRLEVLSGLPTLADLRMSVRQAPIGLSEGVGVAAGVQRLELLDGFPCPVQRSDRFPDPSLLAEAVGFRGQLRVPRLLPQDLRDLGQPERPLWPVLLFGGSQLLDLSRRGEDDAGEIAQAPEARLPARRQAPRQAIDVARQ
ncbi:MAG TPA: hypothetical protein VGG06_02195 [Thermoanaerobaculia bacterium]